MKIRRSIQHRFASRSMSLVVLLVIAFGGASVALAQTQQQLFASPEEATRALVTASQAKDQSSLARIFGPRIKDLLSGDTVSDANDLSDLSAFISEATKLQKEMIRKLFCWWAMTSGRFPFLLSRAAISAALIPTTAKRKSTPAHRGNESMPRRVQGYALPSTLFTMEMGRG